MSANTYVIIDYTNWRGERSERLISPGNIWFGATQWHREPQWLLHAYDVQKGEKRDFAMRDIHAWRPYQNDFSGNPG